MIPVVGRVLGLDLGSVRIGLAISDSDQRVASALGVLTRGANAEADRRSIAGLVQDEGAVGMVVGVPFSLDGSIGPSAQGVLHEIDEWAGTAGWVPLETVDERLTTVAAHQALRAGGRRGQKARQRVDSVAAALLLQSWLDRRLARATAGGRRP